MRFTLLLVSLLATSVSFADVISCTFTEPFVSTIYNSTDNSLTILNPFPDARLGKSLVEKPVSLRLDDAGVIEIFSRNGQLLQRMTINGKGSDGMSDKVYLIDVEWRTPLSSSGKLFGGCDIHRAK